MLTPATEILHCHLVVPVVRTPPRTIIQMECRSIMVHQGPDRINLPHYRQAVLFWLRPVTVFIVQSP